MKSSRSNRLTVLTACLLGFAFALLTACSSSREVGSKGRPFTMYFVPSVDSQTIAQTAGQLTEFISDWVSKSVFEGKQKFYVTSAIPASYIAVVEAFGTNKADFAAFNTFSYILTKDIKKYDCEAILTMLRGKDGLKYKGAIITRADSGINTIEDLKGKKFAYTDPASTSGYILPLQLFKSKGIELGETTFAQKHDNVVTMVYQKQVDAGAIYYSSPETRVVDGKEVQQIMDARQRVLTQFPDVEKKVKIISFTDEIPNEPWVIRGNLSKDPVLNGRLKNEVRDAIIAFADTPNGAKLIHDLYSVTGVARSNDDTYAAIRKMVLDANVNLEEQASKKK